MLRYFLNNRDKRRIQDFVDRGQPLSLRHKHVIWQHFCWKLYENERNWAEHPASPIGSTTLNFLKFSRWPRGRRVTTRLPDPPLLFFLQPVRVLDYCCFFFVEHQSDIICFLFYVSGLSYKTFNVWHLQHDHTSERFTSNTVRSSGKPTWTQCGCSAPGKRIQKRMEKYEGTIS